MTSVNALINIYRVGAPHPPELPRQKWFCFKQPNDADFDAIRRASSAVQDATLHDQFAARYDTPSIQSEGFGDGYAFR